jgi:hypothetical protein
MLRTAMKAADTVITLAVHAAVDLFIALTILLTAAGIITRIFGN